jgi:hypothetical protein
MAYKCQAIFIADRQNPILTRYFHPATAQRLTIRISRRCGSGKTHLPIHDFSGKARIPFAA